MSELGSKRIIKIIAIIFIIILAIIYNSKASNAEANGNEMEFPSILDNKKNQKVAYLTFDDGPSENTIPILDILDKYNIKATFFVMANPSTEGIKGYKEMIKRGHVIALHTYSHDYKKIYISTGAFYRNINKLEDFLWGNFKVKTNILRFPGGSKNVSSKIYGGPTIMKRIIEEGEAKGYRYFDWNIDSKDGISPRISVYTITSQVLNGAKDKDKAFILLHDIGLMDNTVTALPTIIKGLKNQGFVFDVIDSGTEEMQFK